MTPVFSVIIPVFNAAETIVATVNSVLDQSEGNFELLLIDDGSSDASLPALLRLADKDGRIRVIAKGNEGVAATRNLGIDCARGSLVAFLDADDRWHPEKLATHRDLHCADPGIGISFAQIAFVETGSRGQRPLTLSTVPEGPLSLDALIAENAVCTASNLVATAECLHRVGGFRRSMGFAEDQEWLVRAVAMGERIEGIDRLLVDYRMSPGGLSANLGRMYAGWRRLAVPHRHRINLPAAEAVYCRYLARRALRTGGRATEALGYAWRGIRLDAAAFFADARRGGMTLAAALASPLIPAPMRTRLFA